VRRWDTIEAGISRAPRYVVEFALEYRLKGEREWLRGHSHNVSRSGILFSASSSVPPDREILIRLPLPLESGVIICNAKTVRTDQQQGTSAAAFAKYRFQRGSSEVRVSSTKPLDPDQRGQIRPHRFGVKHGAKERD
jgi:hypothetical protein